MVFGVTTFILVLLLVRPIGKLRVAARSLANGELATRVAEPDREERLFGGDEIQGLVHDFNYMAERMERLVGAQKMLLRDVSHELRSPLARLSVGLELAREEAPSAMMGHLQRIEREAGRLNLLIGQLLRLSSMESTDVSTHSDRFNLNGLLEEPAPRCGVRGATKALQNSRIESVRLHGPGEPRTDLSRHREYCAQRHSLYPAGICGGVEDRLRRTRRGKRMVTLDVSDCGPGLPEKELENIFRPFYRVDDARQLDTGGFGVGLAIADRAVRLHHGEVRARNRPEGGLIVSMKLPCEK